VVKGLSPYPEGQALTREEIRVSLGIRERRRGQRVEDTEDTLLSRLSNIPTLYS
jgi:hypothetical protein